MVGERKRERKRAKVSVNNGQVNALTKILELVLFTLFSLPLKCNDNSDKDGAADSNVIERVEKLWEEESIELASVREWPVEDSGHAVVKQAKDKENIVKAGEDYKEVVEGVLHII